MDCGYQIAASMSVCPECAWHIVPAHIAGLRVRAAGARRLSTLMPIAVAIALLLVVIAGIAALTQQSSGAAVAAMTIFVMLAASGALGWSATRSPDRLTARTQAAIWLELLPILAAPTLLALPVLPVFQAAPVVLLLPGVGLILWPLWMLIWKTTWTRRCTAFGVAYPEPRGRLQLAAGVTLSLWNLAVFIILIALIR